MPDLNTPHRNFSNTLKNKLLDQKMWIRIIWKQKTKVNDIYMKYITLKTNHSKNKKDVL